MAAISSLTLRSIRYAIQYAVEYAIETSNESYGEAAKSARRTGAGHKRVLRRATRLDLATGADTRFLMSVAADSLALRPSGMALLNSKVLILNRSYLPVHVTSVKRAFALLYQGVARAVDEQYHTFDFASWRDLAIQTHHERLGVVGGLVVPRVLLLTAYEWVPRRHVRFSRFNIFARDNNTCQYCGWRFGRTELNLIM